jgi:hypothetical protein
LAIHSQSIQQYPQSNLLRRWLFAIPFPGPLNADHMRGAVAAVREILAEMHVRNLRPAEAA